MQCYAQQLMGLAHGISQFLQGKVEEGGSFPGRTYYGETFALALFGLCGVEDKLQCARMLNFYAALDQSSCEIGRASCRETVYI